MTKIKIYPTKVEEPNANESSGLSKYCFRAVESKNYILTIGCHDQHDPKYYHPWTDLQELKKGGQTQCGRRSSHGCSHATYYNITGYRNTCPIAGVSGTFTQPAKIRLHFSPKKEGIESNDKIKSVTISFKHRRVGVDVANDKIYESWGPNFCGYSEYPNRKVLKVSFAGETIEYNKNPPLSKTEYSTVSFTFKDVKFKDLNKGYIDIQYGNNLSTNPGNIYLKGLTVEVDYSPGQAYLEGSTDNSPIYTSNENECKTIKTFKFEAGYKQNGKKISVKNAPKVLNNQLSIKLPKNITKIEGTAESDKKTYTLKIRDDSNTAGKKTIKVSVKGTNIEKEYDFETKKQDKPKISFPTRIEHNVKPNVYPSVIGNTGCTKEIKVYVDNTKATTPFYSFPNVASNRISNTDAKNFYTKVATELSCGQHILFFKMGDGTLVEHKITIIPTNYDFQILYNGGETSFIELDQDKTQNTSCQLVYKKRTDVFTQPTFYITNPTYGKILTENGLPSRLRISETKIPWNTNNEIQKELTIGTYYSGDYQILIEEENSGCQGAKKTLNVKINQVHKQKFEEIFVRGEDSTAFDYDYLVALEGDNITKPLFVETFTLGASYNDIKICTEEINIAGLSRMQDVSFNVTNTSDKDIENLYLELNALTEDDDGKYQVATKEWFAEDGIFQGFKEYFDIYNKEYSDIVSIKNLTPDDDTINEEDVYIQISKIQAGETFNLKIPFKGSIEKNVYLQILLFGEPLSLYPITDCSDKSKSFSTMKFIIYDSILTEMSITGDLDILETFGGECPLECFETENGITYQIKNIDSSDVGSQSTQTIIKNDPRLIPYKVQYKDNNPIDIDIKTDSTVNISEDRSISLKYGEYIENFILNNIKVDCTIKFPDINYSETEFNNQKYSTYTNSNGEAIFYINIPNYLEESYTIESLYNIATIEISNKYFKQINGPNSKYTIKPIKNFITYKAGQTVPFRIECIGHETKFENEIIFNADINKAGQADKITLFYKACNIPQNEAILKTSFETNKEDYTISYNKIEENIYLGVETKLCLTTRLEKIVAEQNTINRLFIRVSNKKRPNKDIFVKIKEDEINKYSYLGSELESGDAIINEGEILWNISYLEKNTSIKGYFDFKADTVGKSSINISTTDFLHKEGSTLLFGEDSYKCECRKNGY